jgi:DtxR family Mn-dependent transcriptional regulator
MDVPSVKPFKPFDAEETHGALGNNVREPTSGAAHVVTRGAEHYLQAIYALAAERRTVIGARLAQHLRVSAPSVTQALKRLERDGFVTLVAKGDRKEVLLTPAGFRIGEASTRKHRLIETWLVSSLKLRSTEAHEAAERLEDGFNDLLLHRLFDAIGRPLTCPHGNPIPGWGTMDHDGIYLDAVSAGDAVEVGRITEEAEADLDLLAYLERNGVFPRTSLHIVAVDRLSGAVTARTGAGLEVRVEKRSAALIFVRVTGRA